MHAAANAHIAPAFNVIIRATVATFRARRCHEEIDLQQSGQKCPAPNFFSDLSTAKSIDGKKAIMVQFARFSGSVRREKHRASFRNFNSDGHTLILIKVYHCEKKEP